MRVSSTLLVGLLLLLARGAAAQTVQRVSRPPPLTIDEEEEPRCELFRGSASGNSDALVELRLCRDDDGGLSGEHQWSSTESGWSRRELRGRWEEQRFVGRETRFIESRPQPGWRFCLIDEYALTRDGGRLSGSYHSSLCDDDGSFELRQVRVGGWEPPPPGPVELPPPPEEREGLCSVSARGGRPPAGLLAFLVVAAAFRRATR